MKKVILTMALAVVAAGLSAQTQQGVVKTKGRMAYNGKYVAGSPLGGVIVTVQGRNQMMSQANGKFSFTVSGAYYLQQVEKAGYVVSDPDQLKRRYNWSKTPLYVVMEDEAQQQAERKAIERRISSNLYAELERKSNEIEALKEQNKITEDRYQELLRQLNAEQASNEQIVKEMAEVYVRMDFDQVDDFYRQVSKFILNGELLRADSMLNTKGNVRQSIDEQLLKGQEIEQAQRRLDKARAALEKTNEELAQRCLSKYQIFKLQHQNDSAAYYLEERARIDTTNVGWQLRAGQFLSDYMADAGGAMKYFKRALSVARDSADLRAAYNNVGTLLHDMGRYSEALEYLEKALPYFSPYDKEHDELLPTLYSNLSATYKWLDNYEQAIHNNAEALRVSMKQFGEEHEITAECYNNMGQLYSKMKEHEKSLEALLKSTAIFEKLEGDFDFERATCYNNVAGAYKELGQFPQAEEYYLKSLELRKKVLGENNPRLATVYNNLGVFFRDLKEYDKALEYYEQAVRLWETSAITRKNLIPGYGNLAVIYDRLGRYEEALATFEKGETVAEELYRWGEPDAMIFLQYVYETLGKLAPTSEAYRQRFDHFMDDKAIVGLVPKGASAPTSQRGMEGVYFILAFGNWNIDSPTSFFQEEEVMSGKPKTVVFLQNGQVREEHFDNMVGCGWRIYRVTPEQKQAIRDSYAKWKAKH